eukprot:1150862-Pelagomonas_calceolata.AAC.4
MCLDEGGGACSTADKADAAQLYHKKIFYGFNTSEEAEAAQVDAGSLSPLIVLIDGCTYTQPQKGDGCVRARKASASTKSLCQRRAETPQFPYSFLAFGLPSAL